jgi:selenocysteine lyase/cysteine desulfurase
VKAAIEYVAAWGEGATLRDRVVSAVSAIAAHEHGLARRYDEEVRRIPGVTRWGVGFDDAPRAPTVSITIDGVAAEAAARRLGEAGVLVWDGHFYAVRPVEVLGLVERGGLLRTGFSMYNTSEEVDRLLAGVADIARHRG